MKPKALHKEAMEYSFKAKQALAVPDYTSAFDLYKKAAELESKAAEIYFDKPELEPTRGILIRSAAFLNLKAGLIENAQKFIFFGLLNIEDVLIKKQLNDALEIAISFKGLNAESASSEYNYLTMLRQRSEHYILEPSSGVHGTAVSMEMVKDFANNFLRSLRAFALSSFNRTLGTKHGIEATKEFEDIINPLISGASFGSFRFSIANDFVPRMGESSDLVKLKSNIISNYHREIFTNPLSDSDIDAIKQNYEEYEVNQIFRPLGMIKSRKAPYRVGYYDTDNFSKIFLKHILSNQRKKLLTVQQISQEEIGELENSIVHTRSLKSGKVTKKTLLTEHLKSYEFDIKTKTIETKDKAPIILNDEIIIIVNFDSATGFQFSFADLKIENSDTEYQRGLDGFYSLMYGKFISLAGKEDKYDDELKDWDIIKKLVNDPESLKN